MKKRADKQGKTSLSRRSFGKLAVLGAGASAAVASTGCSSEGGLVQEGDCVPQPPATLQALPTACDYCIVGCAYEIYKWPVGEDAVIDAPTDLSLERWIGTNMHTVVQIDGAPHNVVVLPHSGQTVNKFGNHSTRGGTLAQKLYSEDRDTRDRLKQPMLRVDGELHEISWDDALQLAADLSRHAIDNHGEASWAMKMFSYQYYENTYALTKLALDAVDTPAWTVHDKPSETSDTPGLSDAGINAYNASYQDWYDSEVIFVSGVSLYDAKTILFLDWIKPGGAKLIVVNPRKDVTAAYAEKWGGLHLQLIPGTDTVLQNAIARHIVENGWEDADFIAQRTASRAEIDQETSFRRQLFGMTYEEFRDFLLADDTYTLENAAAITGVPASKLAAAAEMMARPTMGVRPKTSMMLEKGNYWSHNFDNTSSLASLGLLVGAGGRPGQIIGRAGGHQRGMIKGGSYPLAKSPDQYDGNPLPLNVDRWVAEGNTRFAWVIGTTWFAAMGASSWLANRVAEMTTSASLPQLSAGLAFDGSGGLRYSAVLDQLRARMDAGGMVMVDQDIYPNPLSAGYADLVLPAATWGEEDFTRMQGERRLRIYSKIMDPPGEARPDWWIASQVAQRMGYDGFDWADANAVFEEAAGKSVGSVHDYQALVDAAQALGQRSHEYLRALGTDGIQCPITVGAGGQLEGTERLHDERFGTLSGKAVFPCGSWERAGVRQAELEPRGDELWVTNMRVNETWQSLFDDARIPVRNRRYPANILEIHPDDASARSIESGDWVEVANDSVLTQTGETMAASFRAIAYVTDSVRPGVTCSYFNFRGDVSQAANSVVSAATDPVNPVYHYKLGRGRVTRLSRSEYADVMTFLPRNLV